LNGVVTFGDGIVRWEIEVESASAEKISLSRKVCLAYRTI